MNHLTAQLEQEIKTLHWCERTLFNGFDSFALKLKVETMNKIWELNRRINGK